MKYTVVVHPSGDSWNAFVPDLEGVVATAATRERVIDLIAEAIPFHIRRLTENGEAIPRPQAEAVLVDSA